MLMDWIEHKTALIEGITKVTSSEHQNTKFGQEKAPKSTQVILGQVRKCVPVY